MQKKEYAHHEKKSSKCTVRLGATTPPLTLSAPPAPDSDPVFGLQDSQEEIYQEAIKLRDIVANE